MADQEAGTEAYASSSKKGVMRELRKNPYVLGLASVSSVLLIVVGLFLCLIARSSLLPWEDSSLAMTKA